MMSAAPIQTEAQRLADALESTWCDESCVLENKAAALLRRQDELLEQALEALVGTLMEDVSPRISAAITSIRAHREAK